MPNPGLITSVFDEGNLRLSIPCNRRLRSNVGICMPASARLINVPPENNISAPDSEFVVLNELAQEPVHKSSQVNKGFLVARGGFSWAWSWVWGSVRAKVNKRNSSMASDFDGW